MNKLSLVTISVLLTAILSFGISHMYYSGEISQLEIEKQDIKQETLLFAQERFLQVFPMSWNQTQTQLRGKVISKSSTQLELEIKPIYPLDDKELDTRIIFNIENITKQIPIDLEQYQANLNEFEQEREKALEQGDYEALQLLEIPRFYTSEAISFDEIQINDTLSLKADKDIHFEKEITPLSMVVK